MKITAELLLNCKIGDSQINIFHIVNEVNFVMTIQERDSSIIPVVGRQPNGELELITAQGDAPISGDCCIVGGIPIEELEKLNENILTLIEEQKKLRDR